MVSVDRTGYPIQNSLQKLVLAKQSKISMAAKSEAPVLDHDGRNGDEFKSCKSYGDVSCQWHSYDSYPWLCSGFGVDVHWVSRVLTSATCVGIQ